MSSPLEKFTAYVDSYNGRDKVMRILYYTAQFTSGVSKSKGFSEKLDILSDQISSCRTVLRLFDDIPMLWYTLSYGFGKQEPDKIMQWCGVAVNFFDQMYYPLEHIAWAADAKLLAIRSEPWWTASSFCWAVSMYLMTIKSLRYYKVLQDIKKTLRKGSEDTRLSVHDISLVEAHELLTCIRCFVDFIHAVHWLPPGYLWGGKLSQWHIGALGIISSFISIVQS